MRSSLDVQRRSQLDREVREITLRFNAERSQLEGEIKRLKDFMDGKNREVEEWRIQASRF